MMGAVLDRLREVRQRRTLNPDIATGRLGEDMAHRYLRKQGYTIVARNYRLASGEAEADIIARDGEDVAIVEVKTRETAAYGPPERAIGPDKVRNMTRAARDYSRRSGIPMDRFRLDALTVVLSHPPEIHLFRGAFRFSP
jgi:putative endonuclease